MSSRVNKPPVSASFETLAGSVSSPPGIGTCRVAERSEPHAENIAVRKVAVEGQHPQIRHIKQAIWQRLQPCVVDHEQCQGCQP